MNNYKYDKPEPPSHLSPEMQEFWRAVFQRIRIQEFQVHLFQKACEAHDRAEAARKILDREGLTFSDRFNQPRARPEVNIEVLSRAQFQKLLTDCGVHDCFFQHERREAKS